MPSTNTPPTLSEKPNRSLRVEVWADITCPWCLIGMTRLHRALEAFEHSEEVDLIHRAHRLSPGASARSVAEHLVAKGMSAEDLERGQAHVTQLAAAEGLDYRLSSEMYTGDTLDAHRLVKFARTRGVASELMDRLERAYLCEQRSVFDREALIEIAGEVGLSREPVAAVLDGDEFQDEVESDSMRFRALGGRTVPFFLFDGKLSISGGQTSEMLLDGLRTAWEARGTDNASG